MYSVAESQWPEHILKSGTGLGFLQAPTRHVDSWKSPTVSISGIALGWQSPGYKKSKLLLEFTLNYL